MKKRHKIPLPVETVIKNPVAKYAGQFNTAKVFKDKTKYQRGAKHKGREPFTVSLAKGILKGFLFQERKLEFTFRQAHIINISNLTL